MKNFFFYALVLISYVGYAQSDRGFGIKGGLNYGSSGDLESTINNTIENPDSDIGFHAGIFVKADLGPIYVRPELIYTQLNTTYSIGDFKLEKIDLPVLIGIDFIGPLHFFAGPSFQYILDSDLEEVSIGDVADDFSVGAQLGIGLNLGRLGIDLRYERGFNDNEVEITGINANRIDTRPEQLILALSLSL